MVGILLGADLRFDWKPNLRFNFMKLLLFLFWTQMFYTQIKYANQHNIKNVLEVFAVYGIATSVILTYNPQ